MDQIPVKKKDYKQGDILKDFKLIINSKNISKFKELLDTTVPIKNTNTNEAKLRIYMQHEMNLKKIFIMCLELNFIQGFEPIINKGFKINSNIISSTTPLLFAAQNGYASSIKELLRLGADINYLGKDVINTPLHAACSTLFLNTIKVLVENGANVNALNKQKKTPMLMAVESWTKHSKPKDNEIATQIIEYLLQNKANPNDKAVFKLFDILDAKSPKDILILIYKIINIIDMFIKFGMDINITSSDNSTLILIVTRIIYPITKNDIAPIIYFLKQNADVNIVNNQGLSLLDITNFDKKYFDLFMEYKLDLTYTVRNKTYFDKLLLSDTSDANKLELAKIFIEKGINLNLSQNYKYLISDQIFIRLIEIIQPQIDILNESEIILNKYKQNRDLIVDNIDNILSLGFNQLNNLSFIKDVIIQKDYLILLQIIDKFGINAKFGNQKVTLLHLAVAAQDSDFTRYLLENGAKKNIRDANNKYAHNYIKTDELKELFGIIPPTLWKGYTVGDINYLDSIFDEYIKEGTNLTYKYNTLVNKNGKKVLERQKNLTSLCPICLKYVEHEGPTCMYMTHNCQNLGGFYDKTLYERYKFGAYDGNQVVSWCTFCGRICGNHAHYDIGSYDGAKPRTIESGSVFDSDCSIRSGGGGKPEKMARYLALREETKELNKLVGKITDYDAKRRLVKAMWNAPLKMNKNIVNTELRQTKFTAIPNTNFPTKFNNISNNRQIYYPNIERNSENEKLLPEIINSTNSKLSNMMGDDDEGRLIRFIHRNNKGDIYTHTDDELISPASLTYLIENVLNAYKTGSEGSEKFGYCFLFPTCTAQLHPDEIKGIVSDELYKEYKKYFNQRWAIKFEGGRRIRRCKTRTCKTRRHLSPNKQTRRK